MIPEIQNILEKAGEKLKVAEILLRENTWDDAASRAYYAAFHAISALHLSRGNTLSNHAQLIGRFNKGFIRSGEFPLEFTRTLTRLFEDRQSGNYDIVDTLMEEEARQDVADARDLLDTVCSYLKSTHGTQRISSGVFGSISIRMLVKVRRHGEGGSNNELLSPSSQKRVASPFSPLFSRPLF